MRLAIFQILDSKILNNCFYYSMGKYDVPKANNITDFISTNKKCDKKLHIKTNRASPKIKPS